MVLIPFILCTRACDYCGCYHCSALLLCFACHLFLRDGTTTHSQSIYWAYSPGFFSSGAAVLRANNLWSTPPPKIHHRDYIDGIPLNAKMSGAWQKWDGTSKVCLHYTSHKMVYRHDIRWRQMHRPTHASRTPTVQNCGTSMEVGSVLHVCHI